MWIFSSSGFVSAVEDRDDPSTLLVRARDAASLAPLAKLLGRAPIHTSTADYPYRLWVAKDLFASWVQSQAEAIDYPNFKSQAAVTRGHRFAEVLGRVWSVVHELEDSQARQAPPTRSESAVPVATGDEMSVRPFTIKRIQRAYPENDCVLPDSTPVIAFGNPNTARVATLGINPSYTEFKEANLLRLSTLGVARPEDITDAQARAVAHACYSYFDGEPHAWFKPMEEFVLKPVGSSYFDGSACHLDLTPWATKPVWSGLELAVRQELLDADKQFLADQLREHSFDLLLVNGREALDAFQDEFADLEFVETVTRNATGRSRVYVGRYGRTNVAGWSLNVPDSRNLAAARVELAKFLRDWFDDGL